MSEPHLRANHPDVVKRQKRAGGHLHHAIGMIGAGTPFADIALQVRAIAKLL